MTSTQPQPTGNSGKELGSSGREIALLVALMIVAYAVTIWAMTAKPT